ncbi:MAG: SDR family oxidoreductase [Nitrospinae bacterium]|nr:SDR family oxidoreductase [Nitrospinota bacterium]
MILVTGATGTIGSELVKLLSARGETFRAYVRNTKKATALNIPRMEIFKGDLSDTVALDKAMLGITRVFLLSSPDPDQVKLQGNVVKAAKKAKVSLIVKQSAFGAGADSTVSLARWHWKTEEEIKKSGIPYSILRPVMFMQNLLMYAPEIRTEGVLRVPMKDARLALIDARDIAAVAVTILVGKGHEGKTYELTGPEALSYEKIAGLISEITGRHVSYVDITLADARKALIHGGMPEWFADDIRKLFEMFRTGRGARLSTAVADITGVKPRRLEEFLHDYSDVFLGELVHH